MDNILARKGSVQAEKNNKQRQIDALVEQYTELDKDAPKQAKDRIKQQIDARQIETSNLDDELTGINERIVDPSKLRLTAENFLNPPKFPGFTDESGQYASNVPFGPKNILGPRN
ncbi:MAG: hypothetical protein ACI4VS_02775 [Candidatus Nanosyncoccaceae bacterium]